MIPLPIASYDQPGRNPARLLNVYPQQSLSAKGPVELLAFPGIVSAASLSGPGRGLTVVHDVLYAVSGSTMYRIASDGSATELGNVPGTERLTFGASGAAVTEIVASNGYWYNGTTVAALTDADRPDFLAVDSADGYVVYIRRNSQFWGCSDLNDASSYDPTFDSSGTESNTDNVIALRVDHRQPVIFGTASTELYWNSGANGAGFPYERLAGGTLEIGAASTLGVCKLDNSVVWLASDRTIRRLSGQTPVRISQHGMEEKLRSYAVVSDCVAFSFTWNGHLFAVFRFPSAGACWVYDATTGEWSERATYGSSDWRIADAAECYGRTWVQNSVTGAIGYLSDSVTTEWGAALPRSWTYQSVTNAGNRMFHGEIEVILRTGTAPVGTDPQIMMEVSDDGGHTWLMLPPRDLGAQGRYEQRVRWHRLGSSRDRVYRASVSDAVPVQVLGTQLRAG